MYYIVCVCIFIRVAHVGALGVLDVAYIVCIVCVVCVVYVVCCVCACVIGPILLVHAHVHFYFHCRVKKNCILEKFELIYEMSTRYVSSRSSE